MKKQLIQRNSRPYYQALRPSWLKALAVNRAC